MIDGGLVELLACPICRHAPLDLRVELGSPGNVIEGALVCSAGPHNFPISHGLPILLPEGFGPDLSVRSRQWMVWRSRLNRLTAWREWMYGPGNQRRVTAPDATYVRFQQDFLEFGGLRTVGGSGIVLDMGCGAGDIRAWMGKQWNYYGLDPLPIKPWYEFCMVQALGEYAPFRDNCFDTVLIMQTLDHCAYPALFIGEAHRVLRPGGRLIVQQVIGQAREALSARMRRWLKKLLGRARFDSSKTKTYRFTETSLRALLSTDFEITEAREVLGTHLFLRGVAVK